MDDYSLGSLTESKNEWCARLVGIMTPAVISGLKSVFDEAWKLCVDNDEQDKYLLTFQTFLSRIPKWNNSIVEEEARRIIETSGCGYLEDLITCVHVIHLKALSCVRVGQKQKKIDIDVPSLNKFVHSVYIAVARQVYMNVYLFEKGCAPLQAQKHARELESIVKEGVLNCIRDSVPVEKILRAYMDEGEEEEVRVNEEIIPAPEEESKYEVVGEGKSEDVGKPEGTVREDEAAPPAELEASISETLAELDIETPIEKPGSIAFSDNSEVKDGHGAVSEVPTHTKDGDGTYGAGDDEDEEEGCLKIGESISLESLDVNDLNRDKPMDLAPPVLDIQTI